MFNIEVIGKVIAVHIVRKSREPRLCGDRRGVRERKKGRGGDRREKERERACGRVRS